MSRRHNDVNVLCLSDDLKSKRLIDRIVEVWLSTSFEGSRHARRVEKIAGLEREKQAEVDNNLNTNGAERALRSYPK